MGKCRPDRIHIIGIPGSGKSTMARACSSALSVQNVSLDEIPLHRKDELTGPERYAASEEFVTDLARAESWVTEGIYCGWTEPLFERSVLIVWLDVAPRVAVWRIVRRHVVLSIAGQNNYRGLRLLRRFAWDVAHDARRPAATLDQLKADMRVNSAATTEAFLTPYKEKVRRCRNNRDLRRVLAELA